MSTTTPSDPARKRHAVVLVGHGAPPSDAPPDLVPRLKKLEGDRRRRGGGAPSDEELRLEAELRYWPRTPDNDPYRAGIERLLAALREAMPDVEVVAAYNEFCAPSLEAAVLALAEKAFAHITVVPTMLTPGGIHSEVEIPETLAELRTRVPAGTRIDYAWPFDERAVASVLAARVRALGGP